MNKLYYKLFIVLFLASAISGCKLDAPVYPDDTMVNPGNGNNNNNDDGGGDDNGANTGDAFYPLGNNNTVVVKIDGKTYTYDAYVTYQLISDEVSPLGRTTILAMSKTSAALFTLNFESTTAGTHELDFMGFENYSSINKTGESTGTVKAPVITTHKLQGSFKLTVADDKSVEHADVVGSFNITK